MLTHVFLAIFDLYCINVLYQFEWLNIIYLVKKNLLSKSIIDQSEDSNSTVHLQESSLKQDFVCPNLSKLAWEETLKKTYSKASEPIPLTISQVGLKKDHTTNILGVLIKD
jgi:hypothetical protein